MLYLKTECLISVGPELIDAGLTAFGLVFCFYTRVKVFILLFCISTQELPSANIILFKTQQRYMLHYASVYCALK